MDRKKDLIIVLDYILNKSRPEELDVIMESVMRRKQDLSRNLVNLDVSGMAGNISEAIKEKFSSFDNIHEMIKGFVKDIIIKSIPDIPPEHVEILLNEWVSNPEKIKQGNEDKLPKKAVRDMIVQFVDYSLGRMKTEEKNQLEAGWSKKYWNIFSISTRKMISDLLTGKISEKKFWKEINKAHS
jgi:hypothetical protein